MTRMRLFMITSIMLMGALSGSVAKAQQPNSGWQVAGDPDLNVQELLARPDEQTWVRAPEGQIRRVVTERIRVAWYEHSAAIIFNDCVFTEPVEFISCQLGRVYFRNCRFERGVSFAGSTIAGDIKLEGCFIAWPEEIRDQGSASNVPAGLNLRSCQIDGSVGIYGLTNEGMLDLQQITVAGNVQIREGGTNQWLMSQSIDVEIGPTHTGPILMQGAEVAGQVVLTSVFIRKDPAHQARLGASRSTPLDEPTLSLDTVVASEGVVILGVTVQGSVSMQYARAREARLESLWITSAEGVQHAIQKIHDRDALRSPPKTKGRSTANLTLLKLEIDEDLTIRNCVVEGTMGVSGARVRGDLSIGRIPAGDLRAANMYGVRDNLLPGGFRYDSLRDFAGGKLLAISNQIGGTMALRHLDVEGDVDAYSNTAHRFVIEGLRADGGVNIRDTVLQRDFSIQDSKIGQNADGNSLDLLRVRCADAGIMDVDASGVIDFGDTTIDRIQIISGDPGAPLVAGASGLRCSELRMHGLKSSNVLIKSAEANKVDLYRANLGMLVGSALGHVKALTGREMIADDVTIGDGMPLSVDLNSATVRVRLRLADTLKPNGNPKRLVQLNEVKASGPVYLAFNRSLAVAVTFNAGNFDDRVQVLSTPGIGVEDPVRPWLISFADAIFRSNVRLAKARVGLVALDGARFDQRIDIEDLTLGSVTANGVRGRGVLDLSRQGFERLEMGGARIHEVLLPGGEACGATAITRSNVELIEWASPPAGAAPIDLTNSNLGRVAVATPIGDTQRFLPLLARIPADERMRDNYRIVEQSLRRQGFVPEANSVYLAHQSRKDHGRWMPFHWVLNAFRYGTALLTMSLTLVGMIVGLWLLFVIPPYSVEKFGPLGPKERPGKDYSWNCWDGLFLAIRYVIPPVSLIGREWRASDRPLIAMCRKRWRPEDSNRFSRLWTFDSIAKAVTVFSWMLWPFVIAAVFDFSPSGLYR